MCGTVQAFGGQRLDLGTLAMEITPGPNGPTALSVELNGVTYVQTITRNEDGAVTNFSQWIPQP